MVALIRPAHDRGASFDRFLRAADPEFALANLAGVPQPIIAVMDLAKGLEFRAVIVMACDEGVLPLDARVADAADEAELDDVYDSERRLLYVACTRARERLSVSGVAPVSPYLSDI